MCHNRISNVLYGMTLRRNHTLTCWRIFSFFDNILVDETKSESTRRKSVRMGVTALQTARTITVLQTARTVTALQTARTVTVLQTARTMYKQYCWKTMALKEWEIPSGSTSMFMHVLPNTKETFIAEYIFQYFGRFVRVASHYYGIHFLGHKYREKTLGMFLITRFLYIKNFGLTGWSSSSLTTPTLFIFA